GSRPSPAAPADGPRARPERLSRAGGPHPRHVWVGGQGEGGGAHPDRGRDATRGEPGRGAARGSVPGTRRTEVTLLMAVLLAGGTAPSPVVLKPPDALREVGFDQKLGETLPLDVALRDESGQTVHLRDYFGRKPVALNLVYFDCPMLCTVSLNGLAS